MYIRTVGDLAEAGFSVYAICDECRRIKRVDAARLVARHGDKTLTALTRLLKCGDCGFGAYGFVVATANIGDRLSYSHRMKE